MTDETATAPEAPGLSAAAPDYEAIARQVRAAVIPGSPISGDPTSLTFLDIVFIPALVAALKKG